MRVVDQALMIFIESVCFLGGLIVATKNSKGRERAAWEVDFVSFTLSAEQKAQLFSWDEDGVRSLITAENVVNSGWKLSVSYDKSNDSHICSITSPKPDGGGRAVCLTSRGPTFIDAIRSMAFKVEVIWDQNLDTIVANATGQERWQ